MDRAAKLAPDNIEYLQRRAGYLAEFGRLREARADLDHSIVLHDRPYLRYERAAVLYAMGESQLASVDLDGAIAAQPENTQFYPCRAVVRAALGRFEEAAADAQVAITRMPANMEGTYASAMVMLAAGHAKAASAELDLLARWSPYLWYLQLARQRAHEVLEQRDRAEEDRKAVEAAGQPGPFCLQAAALRSGLPLDHDVIDPRSQIKR